MFNFLQEKLKVRKPFLYLLFFVLLMAFYSFFIAEEINYLKEIKAEINILEERLSLLDENSNFISPVLTDENLNLEFSPSLLLIELNQYAREVQLDIIGFQQKEKINNKGWEEKVYQLILQGDYGNFLKWLKLLEKSPSVISLDRFMEKTIGLKKGRNSIDSDKVNVFFISLKTFELEDGIGKGF